MIPQELLCFDGCCDSGTPTDMILDRGRDSDVTAQVLSALLVLASLAGAAGR